MWELLGDGFRPLLDRHNELVRACVEQFAGYEVKSQGDSFMVAFSDPVAAVRFATATQRALHREPWPEAVGEILVRIGMHTGEPLLGCDPGGRPDYFGPVVNRSSRISATGHGGQILISGSTFDAVEAEVGNEVEIINQGIRRLRGLEGAAEPLYELRDPALPHRKFAKLKTEENAQTNLPEAATSFVGRTREISELRSLLRRNETRLLTLIGFGGMGKTRTALQLAERLLFDFEDGVWWIEAEEATTGDALVQRIVYPLGVHLQPQPSVKEQLHSFLKDRHLLLVLDNTEQIPDVGKVAHEILAAAPRVKCVVTTRRALEISHERIYEIRPLPLEDAEQLFTQRARSRKPEFTIDADNAEHVAELCRKLECVPLAIELAACRILGMTPREIQNRLNERFRVLQTRAPDLPPRQRALRGAIDWSYDLLTDEDKELFIQLSVFAGGFTMDDAERVCDAFDPFESVMELRRHSLLRAETDAATQQTRYTMLESVRDYAAEKLAEAPDVAEAVHRRHAEYFLQFGDQRAVKMRTRDEAEALEELGASGDNLRAALRWAAEHGEARWCARLSLVVYELLYRRGFWDEARRHLETGLTAAEESPAESEMLQAAILHRLGTIAHDLGDYPEACRRAEASLGLRRQVGDPKGTAEALNLLGLLAMDQKDTAAAGVYLNDALALLAEGDHSRRGRVLHNLARLTSRNGDPDAAKRMYEDALRHRKAAGDARGEAETLGNLGVLAQYAEDLAEARTLYLASLEILRRLRDRHWIAVMLFNLGEVEETEGDLGRAVTLYYHAERLFRELQSALMAEPAAALERLAERAGEEAYAEMRDHARRTPWENLL
jgi:predicted ATPase